MNAPDSTRLRELLNYDPTTGIFTWRIATSRATKVGAVAGYVAADGYRKVGVDGRVIAAHRLAWQYVYGAPPAKFIDHLNGVRDDNRIANLREATQAQNTQNRRRPQGDNPYLGVYWYGQRNKWRAMISVKGRYKHIGLYATPEAARDAYLRAKAELHPFSNLERTT